jgi:hypothetical protein
VLSSIALSGRSIKPMPIETPVLEEPMPLHAEIRADMMTIRRALHDIRVAVRAIEERTWAIREACEDIQELEEAR